MSIKQFVAQTGKIALAGTILPMFLMVLLRLSINDVADTYLTEDRTLIPPIWRHINGTMVPYALSRRKYHAVPPPGEIPPWRIWWNWTMAIALYFAYFFRVLMLHNSSVGGKMAAFMVTLGMTLVHGFIWQKAYEHQALEGKSAEQKSDRKSVSIMMAFAFPAIFASSYFITEGLGGAKKCIKVVLLLFIVGVFEAIAIHLVNGDILKRYEDGQIDQLSRTDNLTIPRRRFFAAHTEGWMRFLIRLCTPLVTKSILIEMCASLVPIISNILDTELHLVTVVLFSPLGCACDLVGRLMQSSAENIGASLMLELCGTVSEVYTADVLLQGKTNLDDYILSIKWGLGLCGIASKAESKVHAQEATDDGDSNGSVARGIRRTTFDLRELAADSKKKKKAHQRSVCCATFVIVNTITEASGLVVASLFWIGCNANPSTAGGGSIDMSQALTNFVIMLFGELVLSDSAVAYISHKFASRYMISIAHEWEGFRETQRSAILGLIIIVSLISSSLILSIPNKLCLTSDMSAEEDWALTACPVLNRKLRNVTNLLRVDDMFLTEGGDLENF